MPSARALRMAAARSWARAARAVCRQIPSQVRTWAWSQPRVSLPVLTFLQSATADAREVEIVSSMMPGSGPILSVGALLQAAALVRRLRSAAAGATNAAGLQGAGAA